MKSIIEILSTLGGAHNDVSSAYLDSILDVIITARLTQDQITELDNHMQSAFCANTVTSFEDCFCCFKQICISSNFRPIHYWAYLFGKL